VNDHQSTHLTKFEKKNPGQYLSVSFKMKCPAFYRGKILLDKVPSIYTKNNSASALLEHHQVQIQSW
jgi:hypothetical protein